MCDLIFLAKNKNLIRNNFKKLIFILLFFIKFRMVFLNLIQY